MITFEEEWNDSKTYPKLEDLALSKSEVWLRHLITTETVLLGLLVTLRGQTPETELRHYLYPLAICLLVTSILMLGIHLFSYVHIVRSHLRNVGKETKAAAEQMRHRFVVTTELSRLWRVPEWIGYISAAMSLVLLALCELSSIVKFAWLDHLLSYMFVF